MDSIKGNDESNSRSVSPSNLDNYVPISPSSNEFSDSYTLSSETFLGDAVPRTPIDPLAAAMDYDPMMMEDDQALGPSVKIHEVSCLALRARRRTTLLNLYWNGAADAPAMLLR